MKSAVFWDRDGILSRLLAERSDGQKWVATQTLEDFSIDEDAKPILQEMHDLGYLNVVVTNQPDIARGLVSQSDLNEMHERLRRMLPIDAIYVCPHERGTCECRKPKPGMLIAASKVLDVDLATSVMVGDAGTDVGAAQNAGVRFILKRTVYNQDLVVENEFKNWNELSAILKGLLKHE